MANQLGIRVKVNLPSKSQLEKEFRSKWSDFKADFTAKVNVEADKNSIKKMGRQIRDILDGTHVAIKPKMDVSQASKQLLELTKNFRKAREEMEKSINMKINNDTTKSDVTGDVASKFTEQSRTILKAGEKVEKDIATSTAREAKAIEGSLNKLVRVQKQTALGTSNKVTKSENLNDFVTRTTTLSNKGTGTTTTKIVEDQKRALAQLKATMTEIASLETKVAGSSDKGKISAWTTRIDELKSELKSLSTTYNQTFNKMNGGNNSAFTNMEKSVQSVKRMNVSLAETARKAKEAGNTFKELKNIENSKLTLNTRSLGATQKENIIIQKQLQLLEQRKQRIQQTNSAEKILSATQKSELATLQNENRLKLLYSKAQVAGNKQNVVSSVGNSFGNTGRNIGNIANNATTATLAMGGFAAALLDGAKKASTLQNNYKVISNLLITGGENASEVTKNVSRMQKDGAKYAIAYGKSQKDISEQYEELVKRGYTSSSALAAMKTELQGSVATGDAFSDVVRVSSQTLDAFNMRTSNTAKMTANTKKVVNELAYASDMSASSFQSTGKAMEYVGDSANNSGISLAEASAAIGELSNHGLEAEKSGTGLRKVIVSLGKDIANIGTKSDVLTPLGIKKADLVDAKGNMKSLAEMMSVVNEKTKNMGTAEKGVVFNKLFGTTGQQAGIILAQYNSQFAELAKKVEEAGSKGTYVETLAKKNSSTAQQSIARFKQAWSELEIMFGAKMLPVMSKAANDMTKAFGNKEFVASLQKDAEKLEEFAKGLYKVGTYAVENGAAIQTFGKLLAGIWAVNQIRKFARATQDYFALVGMGKGKLSAVTSEVLTQSKAYERLAASEDMANTAGGFGTGSKGKKSKTTSREVNVNGAITELESDTTLTRRAKLANTMKTTGSAIGAGADVAITKFGKLYSVVKLVGTGLLSLVPVVGTVFAAFQIMDALGIKPWEIFKQKIDATKDAVQELNKELDNELAKIKLTYSESQKSLKNNSLFNGNLAVDKSTASGLSTNLDQETNGGQNQLSDSSFKSLQESYDSIAKKNHLKLRITLNNYDSIKEQLDSLNASLDEIARKNAKKGSKSVNKEVKGAEKLTNDNTLDKLYGTSSEYTKKKNEILDVINSIKVAESTGGTSYNAGEKRIAGYKKQLEALKESYRSGENSAEVWSTKAGKAIEKQWDTQTKSIRKHINELGQATSSGVFTEQDYASMDKNTRNNAKVAQGTNLTQLGQQGNMIDSINRKLAQGGELNQKELTYLSKQNSSLANKSTNTANWSNAEKQAAQEVVNGYETAYQKEKSTQEARMTDILAASGKSQKSIQETIAAYEQGGASYIKLMAKQGTLGKSMLNLSAEFSQQYGKNWSSAYSKIQNEVDKVPKTAMTEYSFVDKTTGLVDTHVIAKLNEIPEKKGTKYGLTYDDNGHVKIPEIITALNQIPEIKGTKYDVNGTVDAQGLIKDLTTDINKVPPVIALKFLAQTTGFSTAFKDVVKHMDETQGKTATAKFLADNSYFGISADEVLKYLNTIDNKTATAKVSAKVDDFNTKIGGVSKGIDNINTKNKPVKVKADIKDAEGKVSAAQTKLDKLKGKTAKIKGDHKDLDAKVSSAQKKLNNMKGKLLAIKTKIDPKSVKGVDNLKSSLDKIKGKNPKVNVKVGRTTDLKTVSNTLSKIKGKAPRVTPSVNKKGQSDVDKINHSLNKSKSKFPKVKATTDGIKDVDKMNKALSKATDKSPKVTATVDKSGKKQVESLVSELSKLQDKSISINVNKTTTTKNKKSDSVAIASQDVTTINPAKSMSAAIGDNNNIASLASKGVGSTDYSDSTETPSTVSEDVWRYWGNELYTGDSLTSKVTQLENAVTQAADDMDKLIDLSKQRINLDNQQIAYQNTMKNAYQNQMDSLLSQLRGYGFNTNGNTITNLDHAKSFSGDNADKVSTLLDSYKTVFENLNEVSNTISSLNLDKWQQEKNITDYNTTKETTNTTNLTNAVTSLTTLLSNNASIFSRALEEVGDTDYALKAKLSSQSLGDQVSSIMQLTAEFNKLSTMSFLSTDNASSIQSSLESIKSSILSDADAIITLKKSIDDAEISQIATDLTNFTDSLNTSIDRLKTNVTDLQDGLLSGQSFSDLGSSSLDVINFTQATGISSEIQQRLNLETELDTALDAFAKKNVTRTANASNAELQIEQNKYSQLLNLAQSYSKGSVGSISLSSNVDSSLDLGTVATSTNQQLEKDFATISQKFADKLMELKENYTNSMSKASNQNDKDLATQKFIVDQLELQEEIYEEMIDSDKQSITALKEKLALGDLTTDQITTIKTDISNYESAIITAQTNIKTAIKERFDYENTLIQNQMTKYQTATDTIANMVSLAKTLGLSTDTQGALMTQEYSSMFGQYTNYLTQLSNLRKEQAQYDNGSYEYNTIQTEIDTLLTGLQSTVSSLVELNKTQLSNSLSGIKEEIEKSLYNGQTANQYTLEKDVYYTGVDKELELESLRLKANQLENNVVEKRLEALDSQEKMSKIEADYVDKQIDLYAAQEKLNNVTNKKDVQVLKSDDKGNFNWEYVANQTDVNSAQTEVNTAEKAVQEYKNQQKSDYLSKVSDVISGIEDGTIDQDDAKNRLSEINGAYEKLLGDTETFDPTKLDDIMTEYNAYVAKNGTILSDYSNSSDIANNSSYQALLTGFSKEFKDISKDLADIFGKELRNILDLPTITPATTDNSSKSVIIQNQTLELPNVTDAESFAEALKTLPEVVKQVATSK
ncbi:phage tail tape measure protein [Liquorilactobacillus hordei]|uniref:Phage minor tail protein n=1 Tax=Liquorilactobacillus hordei DSM 19519 TaxID=1423759 RepID=A0A0R1MIW1_9LACO|nr:phage tail tape measure protein [Liquorilactobacillus hordei]KRL07935.1 phage minor tail protein [Liquorilactobacillus hordei DSM 19519]QYH51119.1 phage tail tape measure protein [Liquorilactobacillus hordei DSM 19519]